MRFRFMKKSRILSIPINRPHATTNENQELSHLKHKNVVQLLDCKENTTHVFLVMQFCNGGDLADYLQSKTTLSEDTISMFFRQVAAALKALNAKGIVHRDLKPQNILLCYTKKFCVSPHDITLKIADFGFARFLGDGVMAATLCGSPMYMAPEVIMSLQYDAKADLWSIGTIMFQCLTGKAPFQAQTPQALKLFYEKTPNLKPNFPSGISDSIRDLLSNLLKRNSQDRLDFLSFFNHAFFKISIPIKPELPNSLNSPPSKDKRILRKEAHVTSPSQQNCSDPKKDFLLNDFVIVSPKESKPESLQPTTPPTTPRFKSEEKLPETPPTKTSSSSKFRPLKKAFSLKSTHHTPQRPVPVLSQAAAWKEAKRKRNLSNVSTLLKPSSAALNADEQHKVVGEQADVMLSTAIKTFKMEDVTLPKVHFSVGADTATPPSFTCLSDILDSNSTSNPFFNSSHLNHYCQDFSPSPISRKNSNVQEQMLLNNYPQPQTAFASPKATTTAFSSRSPNLPNFTPSPISRYSLSKPNLFQNTNVFHENRNIFATSKNSTHFPPALSEETLLEKDQIDCLSKLNFVRVLSTSIISLCKAKSSPLSSFIDPACNSDSRRTDFEGSDETAGPNGSASSSSHSFGASTDVCLRYAECLVLIHHIISILSCCFALAHDDIKAGSYFQSPVHSSTPIKNALKALYLLYKQALQMYEHLLKNPHVVIAATSVKFSSLVVSAERILFEHAIELCQAGALDELFAATPQDSFKKYYVAQIIFHSLLQELNSQSDQLLLRKCKNAIQNRILKITFNNLAQS